MEKESMKKKVMHHLKSDIKSYKHEAQEDRDLMKSMSNKHEKGESKKEEKKEHNKKNHKKEKPERRDVSNKMKYTMRDESHEEKPKKKAKMWIAGAIKHPGALHEELHVPKGKKIPAKKLEKASHAGGIEGKRANLAITLKKFHKGK